MIRVLSFLLISTYVLSAYAQYNLNTPWRILRSSELNRRDSLIMERIQGCEVHLTKHPTGHIQLFWQRGPVSIFIHAVTDRYIIQDWNFGDTYIHVDFSGKRVKSTWKFSPTMEAEVVIDILDVPTSQTDDGGSESGDEDAPPVSQKITWKNANEQDETKIKTHFEYMEQWCHNNAAFIKGEFCAIAYDPESEETPNNGTPVNGTSANGTEANGTPANETQTNGTLANETLDNGTQANEATVNETLANGTQTNETSASGTPANGTSANGAPANETTANETQTNGTLANEALDNSV